ncbi:MAG TPA: aldehyde ferredoxin oxidoreductase C-terminal domain-containing protein [Dehalococcoidales bacterium]|nr:aldehyde ferredoxin oxidoreductase C-terminal domain-containing protein [Dehalococcoidales bacterium]
MSPKLYGTTGKILRVDLSKEKVWEETLDEAVLRKFLGGTALGVKYIYDEVDPKKDWADPENRIYLGSGPLGGTRMAGSACFSVVTKGAMTGGITSSQANGFFGAYLKFSGFDGILIQGAASDWKYLYVHDGKAELRDGRHLVGQDTWETERSIKKDLGFADRGMSVFGIGPAGENLVRFAGIFGDDGHAAPHNGTGAVMGSKKLKAIAVSKSGGKVEVADNNKLRDAGKQLIEAFKKAMGGEIFNWGTGRLIPRTVKGGTVPTKNYTTCLFPEAENFTRERLETTNFPCWACPSTHHVHAKVVEGPYAGFFGKEPEYEQSAAWGPQIGVTDFGATVVLANEADRLGFDCNEGGWLVGWVMECYEKGLLTAKDLDGLEMTWGNVEATSALFKNIAYRRGFGDVLAEGVKRAAEKVGGEATKMAIHTMKGNTPRGHDHRVKWWEMLDTCISDTSTLQNQLLLLDLTPYGLETSFDQHSGEQISTAIGKSTGTLSFVDSVVVCWFTSCGNIPLLCQALNAATGWDFTFDECLKVGRRAANMMRLYNLKCGLTPDMDKPSPRYGSTPVDGPLEGKSILPDWDAMRSNFYKIVGWDKNTGLPLPETLKELGLEHLIGDLKT